MEHCGSGGSTFCLFQDIISPQLQNYTVIRTQISHIRVDERKIEKLNFALFCIQGTQFKHMSKLQKESYKEHIKYKMYSSHNVSRPGSVSEYYIYRGLWAQGNSSAQVMSRYLKSANHFLGGLLKYFSIRYISKNLSEFPLGQENGRKVLEKGVCRTYSMKDKVKIKR